MLGKSLIALFLAFAFSKAELTGQELDPSKRSKGLQKEVLPRITDPSLSSPISSPNLQAIFEASRELQSVGARIGIQKADFLLDARFKGPVGGDPSQANLASLDGLADSATIDVGFSWTKWNPKADPVQQRKICEEYKATDEYKALSDDEKKKVEECTLLNLPGRYRERFDEAIDWGTPLFLGARYKAGRNSFSFAEDNNLTETTIAHYNYAATGSVGVLLDRPGFLGVNYRYESFYQGSSSSQICTPFPQIAGSLACKELTLEAPVRQIQTIVQAEWRKFFSANIAINPKFNYEAKAGIKAIELPIYFLQNTDKGLTGGVNFAWRSDTKEFTISLFVGQVLGLISRP